MVSEKLLQLLVGSIDLLDIELKVLLSMSVDAYCLMDFMIWLELRDLI